VPLPLLRATLLAAGAGRADGQGRLWGQTRGGHGQGGRALPPFLLFILTWPSMPVAFAFSPPFSTATIPSLRLLAYLSTIRLMYAAAGRT